MTQQIPENIKGLSRILLKIPVPWVYVLAYLVGVALQFILPTRFISPEKHTAVKIVGAGIFLVGALFAGWSLLIFRKARTTTTPGETSQKLIVKGPYRISRNPMYVSLLMAYLGEAGLLVQVWPLVVLPLLLVYVNNVVIPLEEDILRKDFPDEYEKYSARVRRWI